MAGRTDTGVHATGQVASVDLDWPHAGDALVRALNSFLPADMSVKSAQTVDENFHPRFDALSRLYRYKLFCQPLRAPLRERFTWRVWPLINSAGLVETAKLLIGTHDFSAFGSPTTPKGTTVRTVTKSQWVQVADDEWHFEVQANAFLYRMVRRMVFVQVAVAQGKITADAVARSLAKQESAKSGSVLLSGLAPAHGLTLVNVEYKT